MTGRTGGTAQPAATAPDPTSSRPLSTRFAGSKVLPSAVSTRQRAALTFRGHHLRARVDIDLHRAPGPRAARRPPSSDRRSPRRGRGRRRERPWRARVRAAGTPGPAATPSRDAEASMELVAAAQAPRPHRGRARREALRARRNPSPGPPARSSCAAKPGQRRSDSRLSSRICSSPQDASPTGASMPAATPVAPAAGRSRSSTHTRAPRSAARHARRARSRRHRRRSRRIDCLRVLCRHSDLPAPALPGSGSDGRRRFSRPLSPWWAPVTYPSYPRDP